MSNITKEARGWWHLKRSRRLNCHRPIMRQQNCRAEQLINLRKTPVSHHQPILPGNFSILQVLRSDGPLNTKRACRAVLFHNRTCLLKSQPDLGHKNNFGHRSISYHETEAEVSEHPFRTSPNKRGRGEEQVNPKVLNPEALIKAINPSISSS